MARTGRKSIWDTPPGSNPGAAGPGVEENNSTLVDAEQPAAPVPAAVPVVEQLRVAVEKKRDRRWEKGNRPFLIRGVPPKLAAVVKAIAESLEVKTDDVARAFLEFGLECHKKGEINLTPVLSNQRLTLFPKPGNGWRGKAQPGWVEKMWDFQPPEKHARKGKPAQEPVDTKPWRWQVSYRGIPEDVKSTVRRLHQQHGVPLGEVVTALMGHSLEAYQTGRLVLIPQPPIASGVAAMVR